MKTLVFTSVFALIIQGSYSIQKSTFQKIGKFTANDTISEITENIKATKQQEAEIKQDTNKIYTIVDKIPTFPGGESALMIFITKNLKYPPIMAQDDMIEGKTIIRFVVRKTGTISSIEVLRKLDTYQDKEAVRIVTLLPNFIPAEVNGQKVDAYFILPIYFRLQ